MSHDLLPFPQSVVHVLVDHCAQMADTEERQSWARAQFPDDGQYQAFIGLVQVRRTIDDTQRENHIRGEIERLDIKEEVRRRWQARGYVPSWGRIDPEEALKAAEYPREPEVGRFAGEPSLGVFYRGCTNEVHGESESGKSWFVLYVVAQELMAGHVVAYVDYEDDEGSVYRRLLLLGVTHDILRGERFRYHRPNGPMTDVEKATFMESATDADTVVFDGVTEGMSLEGLKGRDEADVATWHGKVTKDLAHAGKSVVVIDHTPHEGNRTIGSQHKKACISGVSYLAEPVHPIGANQRGRLRLRVEKDRPASVRREAAPGARPQWRGDLVVDFSDGRTRPEVVLFPASPKESPAGIESDVVPPEDLCRRVLAFVKANPECAGRAIRGGVKGFSTDRIVWAVDWLVGAGYLTAERKGGQKIAHTCVGVEFNPGQRADMGQKEKPDRT